ncbi:MAG: YHS domain-containing protein [Candidatus Methylacidiphilales bacterium]|nr:YHS domain-containing protein [Candidatus Methylacidiphilales bacterium]
MGHDLSHQGNDGQHHHDTSGDVPETRDPACGMTVDPATAKHRTLVGDSEYFFCSSSCMSKFKADPNRYIKPSELQLFFGPAFG